MFNTKCGCPYCKGQVCPQSRNGWKARRNKRGHIYGFHVKPKKAKRQEPTKVIYG